LRYDNISIRRLPSGRYQYRIRDSEAKRYESATFERGPADEGRDRPGTAAGDAWAKSQLARYRLGLATAEPALIGTVVDAYLADLATRKRRGKPLNPVHIRDVERTLLNLAAAHRDCDLNKPQAAARAIKAWWDGLTATAKRKDGTTLRKNLKLAPRTKARYWIHVRSMMAWAVAEGMVLRDPVAKVRTDMEGDSEPIVFTLSEARAVMSIRSPEDPAWLWLVIMLGAGLRRSEALELAWEDVLWSQRLMRVRKGKRGSGRFVPLITDVAAILAPLGGPDATTPRIGPIVGAVANGNRKLEWIVFRKILRAAGVEPDRGKGADSGRPERLHAHSCRHTFAAMMLASGVDAMLLQQYLGHRDGETTNHYSRLAALFTAEARREGWTAGEPRLVPPAQKGKTA
jgi:integrase